MKKLCIQPAKGKPTNIWAFAYDSENEDKHPILGIWFCEVPCGTIGDYPNMVLVEDFFDWVCKLQSIVERKEKNYDNLETK